MDKITRKLAIYHKKTVTLNELEQLMKASVYTYEDFANIVLRLEEEEEILLIVKSKGRTTRSPSLANQYRIDKSLLLADYHKELQHYRSLLDPSMTIDAYYRMDPATWKKISHIY